MSKRLPVTDHALLRYLERVAGIDVEAIRQRISDNAAQAISSGATGIVVNGICYRLNAGRVVSVWVPQCHVRPLDWPEDRDQ